MVRKREAVRMKQKRSGEKNKIGSKEDKERE